jgi:hypothetical protein
MKAHLCLMLIITVALCRASLLPLAWDEPVSGAPAGGYAVWIVTDGQPPQWVLSIATLTADVTTLPPGRHSVYVTAIAGGVHSEPSNVLEIEVPAPPQNLHLRGVALETSTDLQRWTPVLYHDGPRLFARIRTLDP